MKRSMGYIHTRIIIAVVVGLLGLQFSVGSAMALEDVLTTAAMKTKKAGHFALMDAARAEKRIVAVGERGHILYSDDEGDTWRQAQVPVSVNLNSVFFATPKKGWAVGHDAVVLHTNDGGKTWQKQLDGIEAANIAIKTAMSNLSLVENQFASCKDKALSEKLAQERELALWRVDEAGRDVAIGPAKPFMDVWFKNIREGFVVGAYGYFFHTQDGGETWEDVSTLVKNPDGMHLYGIEGTKDGLVFIVGEAGNVFRSQNGGADWESVEFSYGGGLFGIACVDTGGPLYIYGLRGSVFRSSDLGDTWHRIETNTNANFYGGYCLDVGKIVLIGQDGMILFFDNVNGTTNRLPNTDRRTLCAAIPSGTDNLLLCGEGGLKTVALNALVRN